MDSSSLAIPLGRGLVAFVRGFVMVVVVDSVGWSSRGR